MRKNFGDSHIPNIDIDLDMHFTEQILLFVLP